MLARWWIYLLAAVSALGLLAVLLAGFAALVTIPTLPSLEALTDYRPKIPLRVYSAEGILIGEFGEERREVVKIGAAPQRLNAKDTPIPYHPNLWSAHRPNAKNIVAKARTLLRE